MLCQRNFRLADLLVYMKTLVSNGTAQSLPPSYPNIMGRLCIIVKEGLEGLMPIACPGSPPERISVAVIVYARLGEMFPCVSDPSPELVEDGVANLRSPSKWHPFDQGWYSAVKFEEVVDEVGVHSEQVGPKDRFYLRRAYSILDECPEVFLLYPIVTQVI